MASAQQPTVFPTVGYTSEAPPLFALKACTSANRVSCQIPLTMAGMAFASAPMIILYIAFQKYYVQGLLAASVK